MRIDGKSVLVTGGATGIGFALAKAFYQKGGRVAICGRRENVLEDAKKKMPPLRTFTCDVTNTAACRAMLQELEERFGGIDILVNNASIFQLAEQLDEAEDPSTVATEIGINLLAPMQLTQLFLPHLRSRPGAAVINVTSSLALAPAAAANIYCATKAGLHSFTIGLRDQLSGSGIKVFELMAPLTDTPMSEGVPQKKYSPRKLAQETIHAVSNDRYEIRAGRVKAFYWLHRVTPGLASRIVQYV
jgi:short-subunit dehydrogenase involved in D-alanine esterification of teichoic acids